MIRGSSRILIFGGQVQGNSGPTGPTGPIGPTGNFVTGPAGRTGNGVIGITYNSSIDGITFQVSGITSIFITGIRGNTGTGTGSNGPTIVYSGTGISPLNNIENESGYTLYFRSITFSSNMVASITGGMILVGSNLSATGSFKPNKILYLNYSSPTTTYYLDYAENSSYLEYNASGVTYAQLSYPTILDFVYLQNNFNYSMNASENINHSQIEITIDAVFYGTSGASNSLSVGHWNPYIKYHSSYYHHAGGSGATSGIINFKRMGPFTRRGIFGFSFGSCCLYCDNCEGSEYGRVCFDYVSQAHCDMMSGRWNRATCCDRQYTCDCYLRKACCLPSSQCINTTPTICSNLGGTFCQYYSCGDAGYTCGNDCIIVPPETDPITCCCTNGIATIIGAGAQESCNGFTFTTVPAQCTNQICCGQPIFGACCSSNGNCESREVRACDGIFMGPGTTCGGITCCVG